MFIMKQVIAGVFNRLFNLIDWTLLPSELQENLSVEKN